MASTDHFSYLKPVQVFTDVIPQTDNRLFHAVTRAGQNLVPKCSSIPSYDITRSMKVPFFMTTKKVTPALYTTLNIIWYYSDHGSPTRGLRGILRSLT